MNHNTLDQNYLARIAERVSRKGALEKEVEQSEIAGKISPVISNPLAVAGDSLFGDDEFPSGDTNNPLDYWIIPDVSNEGHFGGVKIKKTLLDNGNSKTQEEWAKYSLEAIERGDFYTPSFPLLFNTFKRAFCWYNLDSAYKPEMEEMRKTIGGFIKGQKMIITNTRIRYSPITLFNLIKRKDEIIHNYNFKNPFAISSGSNGPYVISSGFKGQVGDIEQVSSADQLRDLLRYSNKNDLIDVKNVFNWLTGYNGVFLSRNEVSLNNAEEAITGIHATLGSTILSCNKVSDSKWPSIGMRFIQPPIDGSGGLAI